MSYETPKALADAYREYGWVAIPTFIELCELEPRILPLYLEVLSDKDSDGEVITVDDAFIYFLDALESTDVTRDPGWYAIWLHEQAIAQRLAMYEAPERNKMH